LIVACCATSLVGCCGRHHRHGCLFGDRFKNNRCVDREEWDSCDEQEYDDDDDGCDCSCGHHGGQMMPDYGMPMQSFDSGCGCGGGSSMPAYYGGGMPMTFDSYPQSSNCGCGGGGGMMSMPSYPTFDQPTMMMQPTPAATPTPAQIGPATGVPDSYYSPQQTTPTVAIPPKY
jgi:hypothetical protein